MSADFRRRQRLGLILLLLLSGCSTADNGAANFKQSQKLRQNALLPRVKAIPQARSTTSIGYRCWNRW